MKAVLLYLPVIHKGYINFLNSIDADAVFILDKTLTHPHRPFEKDLRCLDPEEAAEFIAGLKLEGFLTSGTTDADSALDLLADLQFDFILIDLMIRDTNSLSLARTIRDKYPDTRVMLMSDYLLSPVQLAKADTGAIGFIPKPCNYEDLATFIKEKQNLITYKDGELKNQANSVNHVDVLAVKYSY